MTDGDAVTLAIEKMHRTGRRRRGEACVHEPLPLGRPCTIARVDKEREPERLPWL